MSPKSYRHCCACLSKVSTTVSWDDSAPVFKVQYCCIGKSRWCTKHKRWYKRRNELLAAGSKIDAELVTLDKKF